MSKIFLTESQIKLLQEMYNNGFSPEDINDIEYYINEPEEEGDELSFDIECWNKMGDTIYNESNVYESELLDIFGEKITNIILSREGQFNGRYYFLNDIMDTKVSNLDDVEEVNAMAKKCFSTYNSYYQDMRGYILTDGSILYFGDSIDHASISWVDGMSVGKFVDLGNIRIGHQSVELAKPPTIQQRYMLSQLVSSYRNDYLYVDIIEYNGGTYGNILTAAQFAHPNAEWVLNEIDNFFETGEKLIGEGVENNDSILKEMAYPVSFNMEEFKTLKSFNQRIKYCSARLPRIGAGSSRIVFQIDNEKCLKLAKNQRGIAQNEAEDDGYIQSLDLAAEVYDTHPEYLWIEMQLARKAKPSDFQRLIGFNFKIFCAWVDYIKSKYTRRRYSYRDRSFDQLFQSNDFYEKIEYTLFDMVDQYMSNTTLEASGDLQRISSWGIVSDGGQDKLVLIDFGLNDDVAKTYYRMAENKINESMTNDEINTEVQKVNTNPSEKQKESGNYKMGHINVLGFNITIENPKGSYRKGKDKGGKEWKVKMQNHYGYFTKTKGKDGDHIDVFVGKHLDSQKVFVVDQVNLKGEFDESKVMLGFRNAKEAKNAYLSNYSKDWKGFSKITGVSLDVFKTWLYDGYRQRKPFADYVQIKKERLSENRIIDWLLHGNDKKEPHIKGKRFYTQSSYFIVFINDLTKDYSILDTMRDAWVSINGKTNFKRVCPDENGEFGIDFGNGKWHEIDLETIREREPNLEKLEYNWR